MPVLKKDGIELYYELQGSGPPLLLIAGLASDSQSWLPLVAALSAEYTLILMDNRGVGRSSQDCPVSIELMAEDSIAVVRHLGLEKVSLIGHSMGGMVALELAARYPELVDRALLVASAACNPARNNLLFADWADRYESGVDRAAWFRTVLAWILTEQFFENRVMLDGALVYLQAYPWPQSPAGFRRQVEALAGYDAGSRLDKITVPVCVIAGELDILLPLHCSEELAGRIPGAELVILKGAAHSIHSEKADLLAETIQTFLNR